MLNNLIIITIIQSEILALNEGGGGVRGALCPIFTNLGKIETQIIGIRIFLKVVLILQKELTL